MENTKFKSPQAEKRWIELQQNTVLLKNKKPTSSNLNKIDIAVSLMTACKTGFNLSDGRIKKIVKFLKEETGNQRVRYGTLPTNVKPKNITFKEVTVLYTEKDGQIIFREFTSDSAPVLAKEELPKVAVTENR